MADPAHSWAGTPGKPDRTRGASLTLPPGRYDVRGVARGERGGLEQEHVTRDRTLTLQAGPEPLFILPRFVREDPE